MLKYKTIFTFSGLLPILTLIGCASGGIAVTSDPPQAKVRILEPTTAEGYDLGITPLSVEKSDPNRLLGDLVLLEISKEGYRTEKFWLPNTMRFQRFAKTQINVKLSLQPKAQSPEYIKKAWDKAIENIIESQRHLLKNQYTLALARANAAIEIVGEFPQALRLIGSLHYLRGEFGKSKQIWNQLLKENPNDVEAQKMLKLLRGLEM